MDISVIIPMYNAQHTVIRALESVRNQTYKSKYEIIIINDGSSDNSLRLVEDYNQKHPELNINIISKQNGGVASARNVGLRIAKGKWIALLDSDDEWLPNKLEKQFQFVAKVPTAYFVGSNLRGRKARLGLKIINCPTKIKAKEILITMNPQTSTVIFKKEILSDVGLYDESLSHGEDGDLWLRIISKYESWFMPDELGVFDSGKRGFGGAGLSGNLLKMQNGVRELNKKAKKFGVINNMQYMFIYLYNELKYLRRILINKIPCL